METFALSSHAMVDKLLALAAQESRLQVEFLLHLVELEHRKVALELGYPSTWAFLTKRLGLSEGAARRRIIAARLLARFPVVVRYLAPGKLNLTTLCELKDVLDDSNVETILEVGQKAPPGRR
jgi:hypothetical protein